VKRAVALADASASLFNGQCRGCSSSALAGVDRVPVQLVKCEKRDVVYNGAVGGNPDVIAQVFRNKMRAAVEDIKREERERQDVLQAVHQSKLQYEQQLEQQHDQQLQPAQQEQQLPEREYQQEYKPFYE
jgi:hypothetical protein